MDVCGNCGHSYSVTARFCSVCGAPVAAYAQPQRRYAPTEYPPPNPPRADPAQIYTPQSHSQPPYLPPQQPGSWNPHHIAARGFAQIFGLHPAMALLTVVVNTMVFTTGVFTMGVGWGMSIPVGIAIAIIVYMGQKKWYDDDHESALIKALIVGFLTAIPTSLPGYLTIPSGVIGLFHGKRN